MNCHECDENPHRKQSRGVNCWSCGAATQLDISARLAEKFSRCRAGTDYFGFFGLPRKLTIDPAQLEAAISPAELEAASG